MTPDCEKGYATLAVTVLMGALSVIAVAWLDRAGTRSRHILITRDTLSADAALEGVYSEIAAGLINKTISAGRTNITLNRTYADIKATILIKPMQDLVDINRAPVEMLERRAWDAGLPPQVISEFLESIRTARLPEGSTIQDLDALSDSEVFRKALPCLRRQFTTFHSAALPRRAGQSDTFPDGSLVRIEITTNQPVRGLSVIILLTGSSSEPVWVYDWRRFSDPQKETCDEKA